MEPVVPFAGEEAQERPHLDHPGALARSPNAFVRGPQRARAEPRGIGQRVERVGSAGIRNDVWESEN